MSVVPVAGRYEAYLRVGIISDDEQSKVPRVFILIIDGMLAFALVSRGV